MNKSKLIQDIYDEAANVRYTITFKQEGFETPEFDMTEDEVLEVWENGLYDTYNYTIMDSCGVRYIVADYGDYTELVEDDHSVI